MQGIRNYDQPRSAQGRRSAFADNSIEPVIFPPADLFTERVYQVIESSSVIIHAVSLARRAIFGPGFDYCIFL